MYLSDISFSIIIIPSRYFQFHWPLSPTGLVLQDMLWLHIWWITGIKEGPASFNNRGVRSSKAYAADEDKSYYSESS